VDGLEFDFSNLRNIAADGPTMKKSKNLSVFVGVHRRLEFDFSNLR